MEEAASRVARKGDRIIAIQIETTKRARPSASAIVSALGM